MSNNRRSNTDYIHTLAKRLQGETNIPQSAAVNLILDTLYQGAKTRYAQVKRVQAVRGARNRVIGGARQTVKTTRNAAQTAARSTGSGFRAVGTGIRNTGRGVVGKWTGWVEQRKAIAAEKQHQKNMNIIKQLTKKYGLGGVTMYKNPL